MTTPAEALAALERGKRKTTQECGEGIPIVVLYADEVITIREALEGAAQQAEQLRLAVVDAANMEAERNAEAHGRDAAEHERDAWQGRTMEAEARLARVEGALRSLIVGVDIAHVSVHPPFYRVRIPIEVFEEARAVLAGGGGDALLG